MFILRVLMGMASSKERCGGSHASVTAKCGKYNYRRDRRTGPIVGAGGAGG